MAKKDRKFNRKKADDIVRKARNNCYVSDVTDSVEFADEPFADRLKKNKCADKNRKNGGGC
ncbi:MAG: hypothetical protein GX167_01985 [Firmicutes bacterium]|nr:hypothetical protein [Bacillota bacterium]HHX74729.1 hypothetical protein [Bacillota bacterium]